MKRLLAITVVVLLSSAMFFVVVSEGAGPAGKAPASGMWSGIIYQVGYCAGSTNEAPIIQAINVGKGVSTLTGKSDWFSVLCTYCTKPNPNSPYGCDEMDGSGWAIFTAANGDKLHIEIELLRVDLTATPPSWMEVEAIVGGTGRFDGASGGSNTKGSWTSGILFPSGETDLLPPLIRPPQGWVGTNEGWIDF